MNQYFIRFEFSYFNGTTIKATRSFIYDTPEEKITISNVINYIYIWLNCNDPVLIKYGMNATNHIHNLEILTINKL